MRIRWLVAAVACAQLAALPEPAAAAQSFEQDGLRVEMEIGATRARSPASTAGASPLIEGQELRLRFRVGASGAASAGLGGLQPLAWLLKQGETVRTEDRDACKHTIRGLLLGRLAIGAQVNLNEYFLVTLDDNASLSIIDPQIESSLTKTIGMIPLAAKGEDFVMAPDRRTVLVTLPELGRIAAGDILEKRARYLDVGGHPRRIALQPDGQLAWVGDAAGADVVAVDVAPFSVAARIPAGPGPHEFAFQADGRYVFVAGPGREFLVVVDARRLEPVARIPLGSAATSLTYSRHSRQVYLALAKGGIAVVDGDRHVKAGTIQAEPGITFLASSPDGRWIFAANPSQDRVSVIDAATQQIAHRIETESQPTRIDFSETFAYIRHAASEWALLVDLGTLRADRAPQVGRIAIGQQPSDLPGRPTIASTVALLPEGEGILALNSADRSIYHLMEGMNAPMGSYRTYPWPARGLLLADRTLREVERGLYQTEFRAPRAGHYALPFLVPTDPQLYGCFDVDVAERPGSPRRQAPLEIEPLFRGRPLPARSPVDLAVRVSSSETGNPVDDLADLMLLTFRGPTWQWRHAARNLGEGRYGVRVTFPSPGLYTVMARSASRGVNFGDVSSAVAYVVEPPQSTQQEDER